MTERLYLHDAMLRSFEAQVLSIDGDRIELDRTAFYATGGGQPYDSGQLVWVTGAASVTDLRSGYGLILHSLAGRLP